MAGKIVLHDRKLYEHVITCNASGEIIYPSKTNDNEKNEKK
jgi:hypothetical protein